MKISLRWLNEYVDVKEFFSQPEELAKKLTGVGLEVEGFEDPSKQFNHVVVGHVVKLDKHPNADKLTLCQIDVGDGTLRQIVCGAKNHKQGDKVVASLPGAVLPGNFAIKLSKIRDVESQGMLCSEVELGLKKESEGILILPADAKPGTPYAQFAGLDDIIFEINVTPNRADCLSHIGLAREIAAILDKKITLPKNEIKTGGDSIQKTLTVELKAKEMAPRYAGRAVWGVKVGPSPAWLKQRLEAVGMNSINNVVDVTNYVMMEYGQPLHAFDYNQIAGKKIIIDSAKKEKFKTLLGQELEFNGEELTIRDGERAVALAGVMGGLNSGVTDATQNIFIESAHFHPMHVRRSSRRHGLSSDSAQRFTRGTDPEGVLEAMNRAAALIQKVAGGTVSADHWDLYPQPIKRQPIKVRLQVIDDRLGYKADSADFINWMRRLNCEVSAITKDAEPSVLVTAPAYRWDIEIEMDLVEEYARMNGYDKIPENFPQLRSEPTKDSIEFLNASAVAHILKEQGFQQAVNYAFVNDAWQNAAYNGEAFKAAGVGAGGEVVRVMNPLSDEVNVMRQSLLPGLLTNLKYNYHQGNSFGRVYEIGNVFGVKVSSGGGSAGMPSLSNPWPYQETSHVGFVAWGRGQSVWQKSTNNVVYELKTAIEGLLSSLNATNYSWKTIAADKAPAVAHPGQMISLFYQGQVIGFIATLHPMFREQHKIREDVAVAEFDMAALMRGQPKTAKYKKISKFPAVERDFTFIVSDKTQALDIIKEIQKLGGPLLQEAKVFDVYRGSNVPEGHASLSFRIKLQDLEATLAEDKVNAVTQQIQESLTKKFGLAQK
jgi:phenylalanyl-tRNA synthetase beta chain